MAKGKKQDKLIVVPDAGQGEHDLYVRRTLGSVENVVSQLKVSMPAVVLAHADFSTARLRSATQISAGLTERCGV